MFTPAMQRGLGEAALRMADGVLYVGTEKWLFQFHNPRDRFSGEILDIVEASEEIGDSSIVDWRILNAKSIDVKEETFLPYGGRKHRPIRMPSYGVLQLDTAKLARIFEEETSYLREPSLDLGELLRDGKMRPVYSKPEREGQELAKTRGSAAASYFYTDQGLVVGVPAPAADALLELGFNILISTEKMNKIPTIGGWCLELESEYRMGCAIDLDLQKTPDGRHLRRGIDACEICWWSEEYALAELYHSIQYFSPVAYEQDTIIDKMMAPDGPFGSKAMTALRWQGMPEGEIRSHLEASQVEAWPRICEANHRSADILLNRIIEKQLGGDDVSKWMIKSWDDEFKRICTQMESLDRLIEAEIDFNLSALREIAELLQEIKAP
jgi:hypothetical protein